MNHLSSTKQAFSLAFLRFAEQHGLSHPEAKAVLLKLGTQATGQPIWHLLSKNTARPHFGSQASDQSLQTNLHLLRHFIRRLPETEPSLVWQVVASELGDSQVGKLAQELSHALANPTGTNTASQTAGKIRFVLDQLVEKPQFANQASQVLQQTLHQVLPSAQIKNTAVEQVLTALQSRGEYAFDKPVSQAENQVVEKNIPSKKTIGLREKESNKKSDSILANPLSPAFLKKKFLHGFSVAGIATSLAVLIWLVWAQFTTDLPSILAYPGSLTRPERVLSFQGRLTDSAQNPIVDSTPAEFDLFATDTGGSSLWNGTCNVDPDQDGIFSVGLGDDCGSEITDDVFTENANLWLEVTIDSETLSPRQPIRTVAYAINAETLQGFPASASATASTVPVINSDGDFVIAVDSPTIQSTNGTLTIEGQQVALVTASGSDGDITIAPDGDGNTLFTNGNVGIGTTDPDEKLQVSGGNILLDNNYALLSRNAANDDSLNLIKLSAGDNLQIGDSSAENVQYFAGTSRDHIFYTGSGPTEIVRFKSNGNVGIGTTNPAYDLDVAGDINFTGTINANGSFGTSGQVLLSQGSSSPIWSDITSAIGDSAFIQDGNSFGELAILGTNDTYALAFETDGTERVRITTGGNFGIGNTNPSYKLDVAGSANLATGNTYKIAGTDVLSGTTLGSGVVNSSLTSVGTIGTGVWQGTAITPTYGGTGITSYTAGDLIYASDASTLTTVGIGTTNQILASNGSTPVWQDAGIALGGSFFQQGGNSFGELATLGTNDTYALAFETDGNEVGRFDTSGNFGIGSTNPSALLEIGNFGSLTSKNVRLNTRVDVNNAIQFRELNDDAGFDFEHTAANNAFSINKVSFGVSTNAMTILRASGNIGIATTSPSYLLDVNGTAGFASTIYAPNIGTGTDNSVIVLNSSGNFVTDEIDSRVWGSSLVDGSGTANYVARFSDSNTLTTGVLYDNGTNVGIGTTAPSYKLDVVGSANLSSGNTYKINGTDILSATTLGSSVVNSSLTSVGTIGTGVWEGTEIGVAYGGTGLTSYTAGDLVYASGATTISKLGIGTSNQILASTGSAPQWQDASDLLGGTFFEQDGNSFGELATLGTNDTFALAFETDGTERARFNTSGNFGIGTTNPTSRLTIQGGVGAGSLGSELVTNGTFASDLSGWTGANWSYNSGTAEHTAGDSAPLTQSITVTSGSRYEVSVDSVSYTAGLAQVLIDSTNTGVFIFGTGSSSAIYTASTTGSVDLEITPSSTYEGTIDNVSVREISGTTSPAIALLDENGTSALEIRSGGGGLNNILIGEDSGYNNYSGTDNTFLGYQTGYNNLTGADNFFTGNSAGYSNTTGSNNFFGGNQAGYSNTSGGNNVYLGNLVGYSSTNGSSNVFLGNQTGASNTSGSSNVYLGNFAGYSATTASNSIAIGTRAGYSGQANGFNAFVGYYAGNKTTTGDVNVGIGYYALENNTTGRQMVAIGRDAARYNTTGERNVAIGGYSLHANTIGNRNVALGEAASLFSSTGSDNISMGYRSFGYTTGVTFAGADNNINIGRETGYNLGENDDYSINLGYQAGYYETAGSKFYVGINRGSSEANGRLTALLYGAMDVSNAANQTLNINAAATINNTGSSNSLRVNDEASDASPFIIDAAGNVGIGLTAATYKLDVVGSVNISSGNTYKIGGTDILSSTTLGSSVVNSSLTSVGTIGTGVWEGTTIEAAYGGTGQSSYTAGDLLYASGATTLSKLGIGTTNQILASNGSAPVWTSAGDVFDSTYFKQNGNSFGELTTLGTNDTFALAFETDGTERMRINTNGNVGIGTTSPTLGTLQIAQLSDTNTGGITLTNNAVTSSLRIYLNSAGTPTLNSGSGGTGLLALNEGGGNVGIGTTAPSYLLDVNGTAGFASTIYAPNIGTGTDNSVIVLNSSGNFVTDEIDSRVWGSSLVDGSGTANYVARFSDSDTLTTGVLYDNGTNVGIGTTDPSVKLQIATSAFNGDGEIFRFENTDTSIANNQGYGKFEWYGNDASTDASGVRGYIYGLGSTTGGTGGAFDIAFATSASGDTAPTEALRIDKNGNIGIGITGPSYKLDVAGTLNISSGNTYKINGTDVLSATTLGSGVINSSLTSVGTIGTGVWQGTAVGVAYGGTGLTSYTAGDLVYASGATTISKLGIGTTNQILTSNGSTPLWSNVDDIFASTYFKQDGNSFGELAILGTNDTFTLAFETDGTERMRINTSGFVGIGTTNPQTFLHINGGVNDDVELSLERYGTNDEGRIKFTTAGSTDIWGLGFKSDGTNGFYLRNVRTGNDVISINDDSSENIVLSTSGTERFRVDGTTGYVGIGTTEPAAKLDVVGNIYAGDIVLGQGTSAEIRTFNTNENLTIDPAGTGDIFLLGDVGIGTTAPGSTLEVVNSQAESDSTYAFLINQPNTSGSGFSNGDTFRVRSDATVKITDRYNDNVSAGLHVNYFYDSVNAYYGRNFSNLASAGLAASNDTTGTFDFDLASINTGIAGGSRGTNAGSDIAVYGLGQYDSDGYGSASASTYGGYFRSIITDGYDNGSTAKDYIGVYALANPSFGDNSNSRTVGIWSSVSGGETNYAALFEGGNVGIGTTAPSAALDVVGDFVVSGTTTFNGVEYTWPGADGSAGQALVTDSAGTLSWNTVLNETTGFIQNGNSFGANAFLGTNDTYDLNFETDGTTRMTITDDGYIGIGYSTPTNKLAIGGETASDATLGTDVVTLGDFSSDPSGNWTYSGDWTYDSGNDKMDYAGSGGGVASVYIKSGGSGYTATDVITLTEGNADATVTVDSVDASGAVTAISISAAGTGYSYDLTANNSGGTGSGLTLGIDSIADGDTLVSDASITSSTKYLVTYTISNESGSGTYYMTAGGQTSRTQSILSGATLYWVFTASNTNSFTIIPSGDFTGKFDDISIEPITTSNAPLAVLNSNNATNLEIRSGGDSSHNSIIGYQAGSNLITGSTYNTLYGSQTAYNLLNGDQNVITGSRAGYNLAYADKTTIIGYEAGYQSERLYNDVLIGYRAGYNMNNDWGGGGSVAIGYEALYNQTITGHSNNIAVGYQAGKAITAGGRNIIMKTGIAGQYLTTGSNNLVLGSGYGGFGADAVSGVTSGSNNVALGPEVFNRLETGSTNIGIGNVVGRYLTTGSTNTLLQTYAGDSLTTGSNNVYIGNSSGRYAQTGDSNVGIGTQTNQYTTTGSSNVSLGQRANINSGSGSNNISLGHFAFGYGGGASFSGADNNINIGTNTGYNLSTNDDYSINLGYEAGYYETSGSKLYIGINRGSDEADGRLDALIYGAMDVSNAANQTIQFNASTTINNIGTAHSFRVNDQASDTTPFIIDASGNVGIGTTTPGFLLDVAGNANIQGRLTANLNSGDTDNFFAGLNAGNYTMSGALDNTGVGSNVLASLTSADRNSAFGYQALDAVTSGGQNTGFGYGALGSVTTGANNVGIGHNAGVGVSATSSNIVAIGSNSIDTTGFNLAGAVGIGEGTFGSFGANTGNSNHASIAIGYQALNDLTEQNWGPSIAIGDGAMRDVTSSTINYAIGQYSMLVTTGRNNVAFGANSLRTATSADYNVAIGHASMYGGTLTGDSNVAVGDESMRSLTSGGTNVALGKNALYNLTEGSSNIGLGYRSGNGLTTGNNNTFLGTDTGYAYDTATDNVLIGYRSAYSASDSDKAIFIGRESAYNADTADNSVMIGYRSGYNATGSSASVFLGYQAGFSETNSNRLYIENSNSTAPLIYGEFDNDLVTINGNLGIGTTAPTQALEVNGYAVAQRFVDSANSSYYLDPASTGSSLTTAGNIGIGTTNFGTSAYKVLAIGNGTAPSTSIADGVQLYAEDESASSELKVRDEAGNTTTLSPHNFSLIPQGRSEKLAWSYFSTLNNKEAINVDLTRVVRLVEQLSAEQLVYTKNLATGQNGAKPSLPTSSVLTRVNNLETKQTKLATVETAVKNGDLIISSDDSLASLLDPIYQIENKETGDIITTAMAYAQLIVANIKAGLIETTDLIAGTIKSTEIFSDRLTSPIIDDLQEVNISTQSGSIAFNNADGETVAEITDKGEIIAASLSAQTASISGKVTAQDAAIASLSAQVANLQNLQAETAEIKDATVSGTLYAKNIADFEAMVADAVSRQDLASLIAEYQSSVEPEVLDEILATLPENLQPVPLTPAAEYQIKQIMFSSEDTLVEADAGYFSEYVETRQAYISESLGVQNVIAVGTGLTIGNDYINYQGLNGSNRLSLQPNGVGSVDILAGLMVINQNGMVEINGDLKVAGQVSAQQVATTQIQLSALDDAGQVAGVSTSSGSTATPSAIPQNNLEFLDAEGTAVATISAEGEATFNRGLRVDKDIRNASDSASPSLEAPAITSDKTAGRVTIPAGFNQIEISNENIDADSLVYLTPLGNTNNQTLYIKQQIADNPATPENEAKIIVGFEVPLTADLAFNWWIVR